ncbi:MAG: serine/threonine-protein kinase [Gemmatimonadetes bacterium]|nr:serine/threonine-protein kinase [Gemmatimonadota bacterium]
MTDQPSDPVTRLNAALDGRYRVERELGEGGMATVYLADDIKHERKVALKVLKPELAAVVGADRFLAEIKTTANLQHPNILPLFDSGQADSFLFYVMPYVEGESLWDKLKRERQLPVEEAVRIASEVADALQAAHDAGVIHRDIKPANILLSRGRPLVADFGIALAVSGAAGSRLTETGLSVGTPHYMSPEQATGEQHVGPAADTYALGCVLYEMLVGEPPYTGATAQAILGRIIMGGPASATEQRSAVPAHVDGAIRKALETLPADRFPSIRAFAEALSDEHFRHGELAEIAGTSGVGPWKHLGIGMTAVAAAFALAFGWSFLGPEPPAAVVRFSLEFEEGQEWTGMYMTEIPDGSGIVYVGHGETGEASSQLWIRRWADLDAQPIRGTEGAFSFALSPDGREVAFTAARSFELQFGPLRVVALEGGLSRTLVESIAWVWDWTADGVYFSNSSFTVSLIPASGVGTEAAEGVTEHREGEEYHTMFSALPGGTMATFMVSRSSFDTEIWAIDLDTGDRRFLTMGNRPAYASSGHLLFTTPEGFLMAALFDPVTAELLGPPVPVVEGLTLDPTWGFSFYMVGVDGTLIYKADVEDTGGGGESEMVWVSRSGVETPVDADWRFNKPPTNGGWSVSPDGSKVAYTVGTVRIASKDFDMDIWVKELPDGPAKRLTFSDEREMNPAWSPDGESVTYVRGPNEDVNVWQTRADGTGVPRLLLDPGRYVNFPRWSADGEWLLLRTYARNDRLNEMDIVGFRPGVDESLVPLIVTEDVEEKGSSLSPDGRWLAYSSNETGQGEIYVRPFPIDDSAPILVSRVGGLNPLWAHSGEELFYIDAGYGMVAVKVETGAEFRVLERETLFTVSPRSRQGDLDTAYDLSPDDQRFLMVRSVRSVTGESRTIMVQNFFEVLKERVGN